MKYAKICLVFVLMGTFFLWSVPVTQVQAVVQDGTKVTGLPPNTMITIELPDGTTAEKETDDKGALWFPFPDGKSNLKWADGSKVVNVSSGEVVDISSTAGKTSSATGKTAAIAAGGIAAAVTFGIVASNNSDDDDGSAVATSSAGGSTDGGTGGSTDGGTGGSTDGSTDGGSTGGGTIGGTYSTSFTVISDPSGHEPFIGLASSSPIPLTVTVSGSSISITGPPPFVNVTGTITGDSFVAEGTGTVAGFPGVRVTMSGNISESNISGQYSMGVNGGLPGGNAAAYSFSGSK